VEGVAASAFGFQGQKCSACSRLILDDRIHGRFLEMLKARVETIRLGEPAENVAMGPVVNRGSMESILNYIEQGKARRAPADGWQALRVGRRRLLP